MWTKSLGELLKLLIAVSVIFAVTSVGIFFLRLSSDMKQITVSAVQTSASLQQTTTKLNATIDSTNQAMQHLDATVVDARRVVLIAGGTLNIVRDTLRKEQASTQAAIQSSQALVTNSTQLVATANKTLANLSDTVDKTLAPVPELLNQTTKTIETANQTIAAVQPLLQNTSDTMLHVSGVTADVQHEVHSIVYPPPQKWYQKYILSPMKLIGHLITIPIR